MRFTIIFILLLSSAICSADTWVSPIDKKYQRDFPELFNKYIEARSALDKHRGEREQLIKAKTLLDEVISKEKNFAPAYREYGRLFMKAGHISYGNFQAGTLGSTESAILEAIKIEPDYADAYVLLGHLYAQNESSYKKAEQALNKARIIGTELPWLHLNYADLLKKLNRNKEALPHYMKVVNSQTDNRNAYSYALSSIALYYRAENDFIEAEKWYKKSANYDQSAWQWGEYSTFLLFWVGNIDQSIEKGEKAISIMSYGLGKFHLACAYYSKWADLITTDPKTAKIYFEKGMELAPVTPQVFMKMQHYKPTKNAGKKLMEHYNDNLKKSHKNKNSSI